MNIGRLAGALLTLVVATTLAACDSSNETRSPEPDTTEASLTKPAVSSPRAVPTLDPGGWVWPVEGDLKTPFGPDHPVGIDIRAPLEIEVRAAQAGAVTFVGGDPCCDNGYHVVIQHADGFETLYAHLDEFRSVAGALVDAGDVIGTVGMTGDTDEPHLHFEIRRAGAYQDPLNFLP